MCGRTALRLEPEEIRVRTGVEVWMDEELYQPSANVAPTNYQPILMSTHPASPESIPTVTKVDVEGGKKKKSRPGDLLPLKLQSMRWGLVFSKAVESPGIHPINARDDSVKNPCPKPMFARLRDAHRCVVLAQGFYEWQKKAGGHKISYYVRHKDHELLYMAALYNVVGKDTEKPIYSYTIITTDTTPSLTFLHDRIPILLDEESLPIWLSQEPWSPELEKKVIHARDTTLTWYPVDPRVGKAGVDDPIFMEPLQDAPNSLRYMWTKKRKESPLMKQEDEKEEVEGGKPKKVLKVEEPKVKRRERKKPIKKEENVEEKKVVVEEKLVQNGEEEAAAAKKREGGMGPEKRRRKKKKVQGSLDIKESQSSEVVTITMEPVKSVTKRK